MDISFKGEQTKLNDCFFEKKDWRACKEEVSRAYYAGNPPVQLNPAFSTQSSIRHMIANLKSFLDIRWKCSDSVGRQTPMTKGPNLEMRRRHHRKIKNREIS